MLVMLKFDDDSKEEREATERRFTGLSPGLGRFLQKFMVRRLPEHKFGGERVLPLPDLKFEVKKVDIPLCGKFPPSRAQNTGVGHVQGVFQKQLGTWRALPENVRGPRPTMDSIMARDSPARNGQAVHRSRHMRFISTLGQLSWTTRGCPR